MLKMSHQSPKINADCEKWNISWKWDYFSNFQPLCTKVFLMVVEIETKSFYPNHGLYLSLSNSFLQKAVASIGLELFWVVLLHFYYDYSSKRPLHYTLCWDVNLKLFLPSSPLKSLIFTFLSLSVQVTFNSNARKEEEAFFLSIEQGNWRFQRLWVCNGTIRWLDGV